MGSSLSKDRRNTIVYTEEEMDEGYPEEDYVLGQILPPFHFVDPKPTIEDLESSPRYGTYLVQREDQTLQVALWGHVIIQPNEVVMIVGPDDIVTVPIEDVYYPDDHVLHAPAGYSWKREDGKTRISIKRIMQANGW
jgi:hypothetical protein